MISSVCGAGCSTSPFASPLGAASPIGPRGLAAHGPQGTKEQFRITTATRSLDASFQIVTDEGDTVTISLERERSVTYADLRTRTRGEDGTSTSRLRYAGVSSSSELSMQVEGDLSEQELADIRDVVTRALRAFGGEGDAFAQVANDVEQNSLASVDAQVTRERSVTVLAGARRIAPPPPGLALPLDEAAPASPAVLAKPVPGPEPVSAPPADDDPSVGGLTLSSSFTSSSFILQVLRASVEAARA